MKMFYEEPKMNIASLMSNETIAADDFKSFVEYKDPDQQTTKPINIL